MKWNNDEIIQLVEEYKKYECLWVPANSNYNCRNSKEDAWREISQVLKGDVTDIKRKMKNLIAQFYRERKKISSMKKSGSGAVLISKWFAYNSMLFLRDKNKIRKCREGGLNADEVSELRM